MVTLFLDANILLDFYRLSKDDIEVVQQLVALIDEKEIRFHSSILLEDEVWRARDAVVSTSLRDFETTKFQVNAPNFCKGSAEFEALQTTLKLANEKHAEVVKSLKGQVESRQLPADNLIRDLFDRAQKIELSQEVKEKANYRLQVNNPPRKSKDSIADAIHWESLLSLSSAYDMHFVSRDGDFASEVDSKKIKAFLLDEWKTVHGKYSYISLHTSLSDFFKARFSKLKLSTIEQTNSLIERLSASQNFSMTHAVVAELGECETFSNRQITKLFKILIENQQVSWIATDTDVKEFYTTLKDRSFLAPSNLQAEIATVLEVDQEEFFEIPF